MKKETKKAKIARLECEISNLRAKIAYLEAGGKVWTVQVPAVFTPLPKPVVPYKVEVTGNLWAGREDASLTLPFNIMEAR